jgi:type I restriction enzyme, S subunit
MDKTNLSEDESNLSIYTLENPSDLFKYSAEAKFSCMPSHWEVKRLDEIIFESKNRNNDLHFNRMNVLAVNNQQGLIPSDRNLGDDFSRYKIVEKDCFAYNPMRLNVGSIGLWEKAERSIVSPDYIVFKCKQRDILPKFLDFFRMTEAWNAQIKQSGQGSVRIRYYFHHIAKFVIPLPPLSEQRAIARALRAVQGAREARLREVALERERKAALMEHLFTHGTRGEATKTTEIWEMPESWTTTELGNIAEIQSGGTPLRSHPEYYDGAIDWVKTLDLNDGIVLRTEEKITDLGFQAIRGKIRPVNTVMVAMYGGAGTVGKSGILGIPATTNQAVCCIEPNPKEFNPFYLLNYLIHIRTIWMRYAIGTRKDPNISKGIIESMKIPLPPLYRQAEIAEIFRACDSKIAALENEARLHDELFRAMLEELMSGALRADSLVDAASKGCQN